MSMSHSAYAQPRHSCREEDFAIVHGEGDESAHHLRTRTIIKTFSRLNLSFARRDPAMRLWSAKVTDRRLIKGYLIGS